MLMEMSCWCFLIRFEQIPYIIIYYNYFIILNYTHLFLKTIDANNYLTTTKYYKIRYKYDKIFICRVVMKMNEYVAQ